MRNVLRPCASCAKKQQARTNQLKVLKTVKLPENCTHSLEDLQRHKFLSEEKGDLVQASYAQSAINYYFQNCNQFNHLLSL